MIVKGYKAGVPFDLEVEMIDDHGHCLAKPAAIDFRSMREEAELVGIDLVVNTAFRDNDWQTRLYGRYSEYKRRMDAWLLMPPSERGPQPPWAPLAARPGYSNHQSGTAVDIHAPQSVKAWLLVNAKRFNFFATVVGEPWHYDWVAPVA